MDKSNAIYSTFVYDSTATVFVCVRRNNANQINQ